MLPCRPRASGWLGGMLLALVTAAPASADDLIGTVKAVDPSAGLLIVSPEGTDRQVRVAVSDRTAIEAPGEAPLSLAELRVGSPVVVRERTEASQILVEEQLTGVVKSVDPEGHRLAVAGPDTGREIVMRTSDRTAVVKGRGAAPTSSLADVAPGLPVSVIHANGLATRIELQSRELSILEEFWENFTHNLFKPLLLFFYAGFLIPILRVKFEFPYVIYQGLTLYLLIAIGWHGGEELATLSTRTLGSAAGFMGVGFVTNFVIGVLAYLLLRSFTRLRRVDAATVAGYYGSDSAGTFVTCLGVLGMAGIAYQAYMPVLLAVMEIPGCLVALYLVSRLRRQGMDPAGTLPDEPGYDPNAAPALASGLGNGDDEGNGTTASPTQRERLEAEREMALEKRERPTRYGPRPAGRLNPKLLHEVFLNPGIYLLFIGIAIGFISRRQGTQVSAVEDPLFLTLFQGLLCLFLLEMGMTASRKLRDLKSAGWRFVAFGLIAPNLFAAIGILVAVAYSHAIGRPFELGTYVLFAVLCGSASYIAVPAIQRLAIPEASPTLPLAASLGLTFSYNVTVGIPVYIELAKLALRTWPI
jgi:hypothetical protein